MSGFFNFPASKFDEGVRFWGAVTGSTISKHRSWSQSSATLLPQFGDAYLGARRVEHDSGGFHLDLLVDDVDETSRSAVGLGASALEVRTGVSSTLVSPAGVMFSVVRKDGERQRPPPHSSAAGSRSIVDQVCVDIGPAHYADEAAFWTKLTGWERRRGALPEFEYLARQPQMPFRLLLQRLDEEDPDGGHLHLDIACDDVEREKIRHESLGAVTIRIMPFWTTLIDPGGLTYCITSRNPDTGSL